MKLATLWKFRSGSKDFSESAEQVAGVIATGVQRWISPSEEPLQSTHEDLSLSISVLADLLAGYEGARQIFQANFDLPQNLNDMNRILDDALAQNSGPHSFTQPLNVLLLAGHYLSHDQCLPV